MPALYQVFAVIENDPCATRVGKLKERDAAIRFAKRRPASQQAEVRDLRGNTVWLSIDGQHVDLEATTAFDNLVLTSRKAEPRLRPAVASTGRPAGPMSTACPLRHTQARPTLARPTWGQLEASAAQAEAAQARALRYEHFAQH